MPLKVAELVATLDLDRAGYQQGLAQSQTAMVQFGQKAEQANAAVAKSYERLASEAKKSGDAAATAAVRAVEANSKTLDATEAVRRAEVKLQTARGRLGEGAGTEAAIRAEADLASARRKAEIAASREAIASDKATAAVERAVAAAKRADQAYANMGTSAARGMQQVSQAVQRSNPFAGMGAMGKAAGEDIGGNLAGAIPGPLAAAARAGGPIGMAVMAIAAVGFVAGKTLADNVVKGFEIQQQQGFAKAKFGWTDAQAAEAGKAAAGAYTNGWGESVQANREAAGVAIQAGLLNGNATAAQMQPVVEKLNVVTKILGTDVPETARAAGQMMKTGMAKDSAEALDLLTSAQQNGLNVSNDLLDTITEYGTQYRKLGMDGKTALGTISQMMKGGARDTDKAADALKEFSIRAVDGSKSTTDAFTSLHLDAQKTAEAFAKGGDSAKGMTQVVWTALSSIKDPLERNRIGLELFGTQWEDLGGAIDRMDLSKAPTELGNIGGAADAAADKIRNGPGAAMTQAKRDIEVAADNVRVKLAEAFGPQVTEAAKWVKAHVNEITDALTKVGAVAIGLVGGFEFTFGALLKGAALSNQALAGVAEAFLKMVRFALDAASHIPGPMGDIAKSQVGVIDKQLQVVQGWKNGADAASRLSDSLIKGSVSLGKTATDLWNTKAAADDVTKKFGDLALKVKATPDGKFIEVTDNTPETKKKLEDLGGVVRTLPDGTVLVDAKDEAAKAKLAELLKPETKYLTIKTQLDNASAALPTQGPGIRPKDGYATGGFISGPGTGTSDSIPAMLSNGEFVVSAGPAARFAGLLQAINADRVQRFANGGPVAYGLPVGTNTGGYGSSGKVFPDWVHALEQQFGVKASTYAGHQEGSGQNKGIDWSGPVEAMQKFAEYAAGAGLEQVIWENPTTGKKIGILDGKPVGPGTDQPGYYRDDWADHRNHVHTRQSWSWGPGVTSGTAASAATVGPDTIPLVQNPDGTWGSSDPEWNKLIKRESGGKADVVQGVKDQNSASGDLASGLFQITKGTWASAGGTKYAATAGEATPQQQAEIAAAIFNRDGGSPWGAGLTGRESVDALRAGITKGTPITSGSTGSDATPTTGSGGTQNVYVTGGKLDSVGSGTGNTGSQFKFSLFSSGGHVRGPGTTTSDSIPAMLSNGEYVINAKSARANYPLIEAINQAGGVLRLAGGGPVIPKIEAPKIAPQIGGMSLMPGGALPLAGAAPTVTAGNVPAVGVDPIAALTGGNPLTLGKQEGVSGTSTPQEYAVQRLIQYGGDMAKVLVQAGKEIALPSGLDSQQAQNVIGLIKGVGNGIQASHEKSQSSSSTSTSGNGAKTVQHNTTNNFYTQNVDEAFRKQTRNDSIKSLTYDGSLV